MTACTRAQLVRCALSLGVLAAAGCAARELADATATAWPAPAVARLLPADEEAPDEMVEFYEHDGEELKPREEPRFPEPVRRRRGRAAGQPSGMRFGLRLGYLMVGGAEDFAWPETPFGGLFVRMGGDITVELGSEFATLSADDVDGSSTLVFLRGEFLFALGTAAHFVLGGQAILETPDLASADETVTGGSAGAGLGLVLGKFDIRATYNMIIPPDADGANTLDFMSITAGYGF
jgi:hypothetical protein